MKDHPMQPIYTDDHGVARFRKNSIVEALLAHSAKHGFDLNEIARGDFPQEDRMQFAQLIGYSVSGYGSLSYTTSESEDIARAMIDDPDGDEKQLRIEALETQLNGIKYAARSLLSHIFRATEVE